VPVEKLCKTELMDAHENESTQVLCLTGEIASIIQLSPRDALIAGRKLGAGGFAAIDFETATSSRVSACAIGLAIVEGGTVVSTRRWYIQPPENEYDWYNTKHVHHITPDATKDSPNIAAVWPEVFLAIGSRPLVAHGAAFDADVLRQSLGFAGCDYPTLTWFCTYKLAQQAWQEIDRYRLKDLANECGIEFCNYNSEGDPEHDPEEDAKAAAEVAIACCGLASERRIEDASNVLARRFSFPVTTDELALNESLVGKSVVFTGKLSPTINREGDAGAQRMVEEAGGQYKKRITKDIDYLVIGTLEKQYIDEAGNSKKMREAEALRDKGYLIKRISGEDFLRLTEAVS
jgi:DNA polymerase-3 subunit epsilon